MTIAPEDLNDEELYHEYQDAKEFDQDDYRDDLQDEIAGRWEEYVENAFL